MSFQSLSFVYFFLPFAAGAYFLARKSSLNGGHFVLTLLSLVFFALNSIPSIPVLLLSILLNYFMIGRWIVHSSADGKATKAKIILSTGILLNLLILGLFKYADSLLPALNTLLDSPVMKIAFPLAISFYTFSQISYLIQIFRGECAEPQFLEYLTYILFFPKIIAGPIARPNEFIPQIRDVEGGKWNGDRALKAAAFFFIGLFKKVIIADQLAPYATALFETVDGGKAVTFYHAWCGMFIYGFQLYFDFSGYCDMAIGVALLFGISLPVNFDAPYRAVNISEFWRKWHISLSFFFRDYVYFPLGGNRKGKWRNYANLMIIMILCGAWHGSTVLFLIWGGVHGTYLALHAAWRNSRKAHGENISYSTAFGRITGIGITFLAVTLAWIPFRAATLDGAGHLFMTMVRLPSVLPKPEEITLLYAVVLPLMIIAWFFPTTQKWLDYTTVSALPDAQGAPALAPGLFTWKKSFWYGLIVGCIAVIGITSIAKETAFIYKGF